MTLWLEETLLAMPAQGRLGIKVPGDLAFGFTDDRRTEKGNQDRLAVAYCLDASLGSEKWFFAGVCDGVGGEAHGEVAASIALSEIISHLCVGESGPHERRLDRAILRAHAEVQRRLHKRSATTFAGVIVTSRGGYAIGSVGDSRIYSISKNEVTQLTQDDTLAEMLRRQATESANQRVQDAIMALQPQWQESLGQAIGSELPLQPRTAFWPQVSQGSGCLLCTDGVWKPIEPVLAKVVSTSPERLDLARRLLTLTDHLGATDNSTAIVIPELAKVVHWLRSKHRDSEQGLVHLVLPGEMAVVPRSLFTPTSFSQESSLPSEVEDGKYKGADPQAGGKAKSKSKTAKAPKTDKSATLQMTFVEGPWDDEASTASSIPKER
jgi:serine/threonine protein phosphatase PrpC